MNGAGFSVFYRATRRNAILVPLMAQPRMYSANELSEFDGVMRKLAADSTGIIEEQEKNWQAARKKAAKKR